MSIKVMSAIFETKLNDLKDADGIVTKASTATLVLLALADHANDNGEGAYPSVSRLKLKTKLSRWTIVNVLKALRDNRIILLSGRSKLRTNNYSINLRAFPGKYVETQAGVTENAPVEPVDESSHLTDIGQAALPVREPHQSGCLTDIGQTILPVMQPHQSDHLTNESKAALPSSVRSPDLNHPLTTLKPSKERDMAQTDFQKILAELERLCGGIPSDSARLIDVWLEKHEVHRILEAIERAKERGARSPKYVDQMLIGWEANGYPPTRTDQVLARAFKPARGGKDPTASILAYIDRLEQCNG